MESTKLSKEELILLNSKLPRKTRTKIAKQLGITYQQVKSVLNGSRENLDVIDLAIKEIERNKEIVAKVRQINNQ